MIIEYIQQSIAAEQPTFTVDTTPGVVDVVLNQTASPGYLRNGAGYRLFDSDDNVRVLSLGFVLPYSFSLSVKGPIALPVWTDDIVNVPIKEFTGSISSSTILLPYDGAEFPVDITIQHQSPGKKVAYYISYPAGGGTNNRVSVVNAPSSLNGVTLRGWFFWKVAHTLAMVAG